MAVAAAGGLAALHYHHLGLTLSHYDARAHLVVARRVFDSLTPGWQQVGAVWLPLPHLLNMIPVQVDWLYRTGASGIAISVLSMAIAAGSVAWILQRITGSLAGGLTCAALLMLNPDVLYLQSTPMTEPLLFGTTFLAVALIAEWAGPPSPLRGYGGTAPRSSLGAGWACVAAVLTRYEAWPIIASAIGLAFLVRVRRGEPAIEAWRKVRGLALYPLWAIAAFLVNSKVTVGAWFVDSGFFVADNPARGHVWIASTQLWDGLQTLIGSPLAWCAWLAIAVIVTAAIARRDRAALLIVLALAASAILPWGAYFKGHPFRIRYDVPLVAAAAALIGAAVALLPRALRAPAAVIVLGIAVWDAHPLDRNAPMVVEAQLDARNTVARGAVTGYLQQHWDGSPILMSMGSLGHYMHDLAYAGFDVRDFLHEGNGEIWKAAVGHPQPYVKWIAVEEKAEGGDVLYRQGKLDPRFFAGYECVAQGGNVALYELRRQ
ncbi:MAG TPA: hypothetical protein VL262_17520 [Vicinamibacterales bacterium]|nr:hypothetical protein [Vicinamibacterales bacterium]